MARLKGAANLCDFTVTSGTETFSYVVHMVMGRLVAGLRDKNIMKEIFEKQIPMSPKPASYNCATSRNWPGSRSRPKRRPTSCSIGGTR